MPRPRPGVVVVRSADFLAAVNLNSWAATGGVVFRQ
jgi:hypothetical protein